MTLKGKTIEFETEKLVFGGTALGRYQNKVVFVYNALPGERVKAWVSQDKRDYAHAIVTDVLEASPFRQNPPEAHFLSCSPWQIMDFARGELLEAGNYPGSVSVDCRTGMGRHKVKRGGAAISLSQ